MKLSQDEINLMQDLVKKLRNDGLELHAKALEKLLAMNMPQNTRRDRG